MSFVPELLYHHNTAASLVTGGDPLAGDHNIVFDIDVNPTNGSGEFTGNYPSVSSSSTQGIVAETHQIKLYLKSGSNYVLKYTETISANPNNDNGYGFVGNAALAFDNSSRGISRHQDQVVHIRIDTIGTYYKAGDALNKSVQVNASTWVSDDIILEAAFTWGNSVTTFVSTENGNNLQFSNNGTANNHLAIYFNASFGKSNNWKYYYIITPHGQSTSHSDAVRHPSSGLYERTGGGWQANSRFLQVDNLLKPQDYFAQASGTAGDSSFDIHLKAYGTDGGYIQGDVLTNITTSGTFDDAGWNFSSQTAFAKDSSVSVEINGFEKPIANMTRQNKTVTLSNVTFQANDDYSLTRTTFNKIRTRITGYGGSKDFWFHNYDNEDGNLNYGKTQTFQKDYQNQSLDISDILSDVRHTQALSVEYKAYVKTDTGQPSVDTYTATDEIYIPGYIWKFNSKPDVEMIAYNKNSLRIKLTATPDTSYYKYQNARFEIFVQEFKSGQVTSVWSKLMHGGNISGTEPSQNPVDIEVDLFNSSDSSSYWGKGPSNDDSSEYPFSNRSEDKALQIYIKALDDFGNVLDESPIADFIAPRVPQLDIQNAHVEEYKGDGGTIDWTAAITMSLNMPVAFRPTTIHFWMANHTGSGDLGNYTIDNTISSQTLNLSTGHMSRLIWDTGTAIRTGTTTENIYGTLFVEGTSGDNWGHENDGASIQGSYRFGTFAGSVEISKYNATESVKVEADSGKITSLYTSNISPDFKVEYKIDPENLNYGGELVNENTVLSFDVANQAVAEHDIGQFWDLAENGIVYNFKHPYIDSQYMNLQFRFTAEVGGVQVDQTAWTDVGAGTTSFLTQGNWYDNHSSQLLEGYNLVVEQDGYTDGRNITIVKSFHPNMNAATADFNPIIDLEVQFGTGDWDVKTTTHYWAWTGNPQSHSYAPQLVDGVVNMNYSGTQQLTQTGHSPNGFTAYFVRQLGQVANPDISLSGTDQAQDDDSKYRARLILKDKRSGSWQGVDRTNWQTLEIPTVRNSFPAYDLDKNGNSLGYVEVDVNHLPGLAPQGGALQDSRLVFKFDHSSDYNPWDSNPPPEQAIKFGYTSSRYNLSGLLREYPKASNAGTSAEKKQPFTNSDIVNSNWTVTGAIDTAEGNTYPGILWQAKIPNEAMYLSDVYLDITETIENNATWIQIYEDNFGDHDVLPKTIPATVDNTRRFGNADVIMNNISNGNLALVPQECELIRRSGGTGTYGLSGYTMKFKIPADLDNYYTNVTPKIIFGARFQYSTTSTTNSRSTIVGLSGDGEVRLGFTPFYGKTQAHADSEKGKLIKNIQDLTDDEGFINYDVNMNFEQSTWAYNTDIDISEDINIEFCFYVEEQINSMAAGLYGNYFEPTNGDPWTVTVSAQPPADSGSVDPDADFWFDVNRWTKLETVANRTLNLKTMIEEYKYYEDPEIPGKIDVNEIDYGSFALEEYEPTKIKFSNSNYVSPSVYGKPFKHSEEIIIADIKQEKTGLNGPVFNEIIQAQFVNMELNLPTTFSLDKDGYRINNLVKYIATPKIATQTGFGKQAHGVAISYALDIPMGTYPNYFIELPQKSYSDVFVPSFSNFELTQDYPEDVTPENAQTSTVEIKFNYNTSAFSDVNKYFATSHEHIKIFRTIIQNGEEIADLNWGLVYSGDIHSLASGADNNGITTYSLTDSNIDTSSLTDFDSNDFFRYNYSFVPGLSYTPGGVTEDIVYVSDKSSDITIMPAHLPQTLPSPNNLSYRYNNKHSITVFWDYDIDSDVIGFLESEEANVGFDIYWRAVDEVDFYYENPSNAQTRTRVDKVRERKYSSSKSRKEISKIDKLKNWNLARTIPMSKANSRSTSGNKFSYVLKYDKVSFKYGIQVAIIPKVIDNDVYSFFNHDISTHQNTASHVLGVNQYTHPDGILVDPSDKSRRSKVHTEKERMRVSDNIAKRNQDYIKHNIDQVPISVTRKRAQINDLVDPNSEGGHKPYTST